MRDGRHVILCIDDDQDILATLRLVLESAGYVVETAATGAEGRRAAGQLQPDLLIVDLMMEAVDSGLTLVAALRESGVTAPIFFLSSAGDYFYESADVNRLGADGVFQKPIAPELLLSVIGTRLGRTAGQTQAPAARP